MFLAACFTMSEGSLLRLNKALRFYNFLQRREGERLSRSASSCRRGTFDRRPGDCAACELTPSDFDFLHAGVALSDVSRIRLPLLTGLLTKDVIAALMNW